VVTKFGDLKNGLVLVGGPTGSGKSTTLAAIIDYINRSHPKHIITLEDPIEVLHTPKQCMINQREIGTHSHTFPNALRATLREDPDVILVGEMRDLTTIQFAITAAETGHLVFGTVHTATADTSVDRLINAAESRQSLAPARGGFNGQMFEDITPCAECTLSSH
jgi:twitching motility protein PilT